MTKESNSLRKHTLLEERLERKMSRNRRITSLKHANNSTDPLDVASLDTDIELEPRNGHDYSEVLDFSKTEIYKQLRPLLICMRVFGLYFKRTVRGNGKTCTEAVVWFCGFINIVMIFNVIRSFSVYRVGDKFDSVLVQKVLFTIWSSECSTKGLLLMFYCYRQNGLPQFFREWALTCKNVKIGRLSLLVMKKFIVITFVFILFNSVIFTMILIYVPVLGNIYHEVIWRNAHQIGDQLTFKIVLGVLAVLNSSFSMFPVSLYVVLTFAISKQLQKFTEELSATIIDDEVHGKIEDFRLRHQNLCQMVAILDRVFSPMIGAVFSANIPMFCLVLFTMVTSIDVHISLVLINLFWLSFILLQMTIVSVAAAWVNVKAHEPLEQVYTIRFSKTSNDVQLQMIMFLNRLTGTQIGLTAMNLFVIDKPTILTVAGMMVTYFVLLIQFKMPVASICHCNISAHMQNTSVQMYTLG